MQWSSGLPMVLPYANYHTFGIGHSIVFSLFFFFCHLINVAWHVSNLSVNMLKRQILWSWLLVINSMHFRMSWNKQNIRTVTFNLITSNLSFWFRFSSFHIHRLCLISNSVYIFSYCSMFVAQNLWYLIVFIRIQKQWDGNTYLGLLSRYLLSRGSITLHKNFLSNT